MHPVELQIHRMNTKAFIEADPLEIILYRQQRVRTDSGGFKDTHVPVAAQRFRLVPVDRMADQITELKTSVGRVVKTPFHLLGEHDADMERWDMFKLNDVWFEIASPIQPEHTTLSRYFKKGDVVRREDLGAQTSAEDL